MLRRVLAPAALSSLVVMLASGCRGEPEPAAPTAESSPAAAKAEEPAAEAEVEADGLPAGPYADRDPALAKQLVDGGAVLLDVRTPGEFEAGHVEGAVNIDHGEVAGRLEEIRELAGGDLHKPVVVYCKSGRRAGLVKEQLLEAGFDRVTNLGGFSDWPG